MSVKLDVIARGATAVIDRNSPKARQDKWMLEVERAMLASTQPPTAAPFVPALADVASAPIAPAVRDDSTAPGPTARVAAQARAREPGHGAGGSVNDIGAAHDQDERKDARGDAPATVPSAATAGATVMPAVPVVDGSPRAAGGARVPAAGPVTAVTPASAPGPSAANPVAGPASAPGAMRATPGSGSTTMAFAQAAVGAGTFPPPAACVQAPVQAGVVSAAAVTMPQSFAAAGLSPVVAIVAGTAPAEGEHQPAPAQRRVATAASMAAESEPYAPSNLHVIDSEDGIHAWVRDARMTAYQEQAVAQAMIAQFVQQGALVGSVTVNGRLIGARGDAERDEQSPGDSISEPPATTAEPITTVRGAA